MGRLMATLDAQLPDVITALPEVEVVVGPGDAATVRVPDVVVVRSNLADANPPRIPASDVLLAVEIVSPGTARTDRVTKLHQYALAGIPAHWVIDLDPPTTVVAHLLVDSFYEICAQGGGRVELVLPGTAPDDVLTIDLDSLTTRR
jgi:Uma2 family endonuclease